MFALRNQIAMSRRGAQTIQAASRGFAGGGAKMPNMDPKETDFDIVCVGKYFSSCIEHNASGYSQR